MTAPIESEFIVSTSALARHSRTCCGLLLILVASAALARDLNDEITIRTLKVSDHPSEEAHNIYVAGQVVTALRFEKEVDPAKTKLLAWEGRFEPPLVGGKVVVLEPIRDLNEGEAVPLLMTLADGTEFAFLVKRRLREDWGVIDHQVNVFKDHGSYNAVLSSLYDSLKRERKLSDENERLTKEENSVDHAYATLLVNGEVKKTPLSRSPDLPWGRSLTGDGEDGSHAHSEVEIPFMPTTRFQLLSSIVLLVTSSGCTTIGGVTLRPDGTPGPQECPEEAKRVMEALNLHVGDAALVELDANQLWSKSITLYDGPIESVLKDDFGTLESTTRLYGQVWTGGPQAVIRYYEAHRPGRAKLPICAVARLAYDQMRKRPESKPGTAILDGSVAAAYIVDAFR